MRLIFGFIVVFILSVIFSMFQGFIDILINIGIIPESYRDNGTFDVMMIFVVYAVFMGSAFFLFGIGLIIARLSNSAFLRRVKKAKKRALKEYGSEAPYFYFLDPNNTGLNYEKSIYVYQINKSYLFRQYDYDVKKVEDIYMKLTNIEELKLYHEAIEFFGLPDIPREYGIFNAYSDEELALFNK